MRCRIWTISFTIFFLICQVFQSIFGISGTVGAVSSTDDFTIEDFTADYYLSKDSKGVSRLKVVENITAVFPDINQNHGITRYIPFSNQGGKNRTTESTEKIDLRVTRNGKDEPIAKREVGTDAFIVNIGRADEYVHGKQEYRLEYEFQRVVTDFKDYQELYWDTNGVGWAQPFKKLTARLHFEGETKNFWDGKSWCYVGRQGSNNQTRCATREIEGGVEFSTTNLAAQENLTFDVQFKPGSFVVPEPDKDWTIVIIAAVVFLILIIVGFLLFRSYKKQQEKINFYKNSAKPPQYIPPKDYTITDASAVYLKSGGSAQVATLMELAVSHKIELIQGEKKTFGGYNWSVKVVNLNGVTEAQKVILRIVAQGEEIRQGGVYAMKGSRVFRNTSSQILINGLLQEFDLAAGRQAELKGLLEKGKKKMSGNPLGLVFAMLFIIIALSGSIMSFIGVIFGQVGVEVVGGMPLLVATAAVFVVALIIALVIWAKLHNYKNLTQKALELNIYLEGLRNYMTLAEKDRLAFLQSVQGVDISHQGVARLYERLLPYATLFNIEDSWQRELERYYQYEDVVSPIWYVGVGRFSMRDFRTMTQDLHNNFSTSSGSGGGSSSFSGGGGGGFSGGGGGGGGGGGW